MYICSVPKDLTSNRFLCISHTCPTWHSDDLELGSLLLLSCGPGQSFILSVSPKEKKSPNRIVYMVLSSGEKKKREQTKQTQTLQGQHPEPVESGMEKSALSTWRERVGFAPQGREGKVLLLSCLDDTTQSSCSTKLRT